MVILARQKQSRLPACWFDNIGRLGINRMNDPCDEICVLWFSPFDVGLFQISPHHTILCSFHLTLVSHRFIFLKSFNVFLFFGSPSKFCYLLFAVHSRNVSCQPPFLNKLLVDFVHHFLFWFSDFIFSFYLEETDDFTFFFNKLLLFSRELLFQTRIARVARVYWWQF